MGGVVPSADPSKLSLVFVVVSTSRSELGTVVAVVVTATPPSQPPLDAASAVMGWSPTVSGCEFSLLVVRAVVLVGVDEAAAAVFGTEEECKDAKVQAFLATPVAEVQASSG